MTSTLRSKINALSLLIVLALLLGFSVPRARAAALAVNDPNDVVADDGVFTLREAIIAANTNTASGATAGECPAGDPGLDTIDVPAGTYTLDSISGAAGELLVTESVTITGAGSGTTIIQAATCDPTAVACAHDHRVFNLSAGSVTITGVTVQHGNCDGLCAGSEGVIPAPGVIGSIGGGFMVTGSNLTLSDVVVTDNYVNDATGSGGGNGGGISASGNSPLSLNNVTISNNVANGLGGGIQCSCTITAFNNVTVSGNRAYSGGGMFTQSASMSNITNSTFSGNAVLGVGGGLLYAGTGLTPAPSIINSTFSGNSAASEGGGLYIQTTRVILAIVNVTFSGNTAIGGGGGIRNLGSIASIVNTIVTASPAGGNCTGNLAGFRETSLSDDATCGFGAGDSNGSIGLAGLANNGGPTQTHALNAGSSAIDGSGAACPALLNGFDQRGVVRDTLCDTGAYEVRVNLTATKINDVNGLVDVVFGGDWVWTIRVENTGDGTAIFNPDDVIATDQLPDSDLSYSTPGNGVSSGATGSTSCSIDSNQDMTCIATSVVTIPPGGMVTLNIGVTPSLSGVFDNPRSGGTCVVDPDGLISESDETDNTCADRVVVVDIEEPGEVEKLFSASTANVGDTVTVTLAMYLAPDSSIEFDDILPSILGIGNPTNLRGPTGILGNGGCGGTVGAIGTDWVYGTIDGNGTNDEICVVQFDVECLSAGVATNTAEFNFGTFSNDASADIECVAPPSGGGGNGGGGGSRNQTGTSISITDPALSKLGSPLNVTIGEAVTWTIVATNTGGTALDNVVVHDSVPAQFDITDASATQGTVDVNGQSITANLGTLQPGQSVTITVHTVGNNLAQPGQACNTVTSGASASTGCVTFFPGDLPATGGSSPFMATLYALLPILAGIVVIGAGAFVVIRRRMVS